MRVDSCVNCKSYRQCSAAMGSSRLYPFSKVKSVTQADQKNLVFSEPFAVFLVSAVTSQNTILIKNTYVC